MATELEKLLEQHLHEGELESHGSFTVDLEQARAKSQRFGQENPEKAVLRLVQVIISTVPERVDLKLNSNRLIIKVSGAQAVRADLKELRGDLGTSLWSCVYSGFPEVKVYTSNHAWRLQEGGVEEVDAQSSHHHNTVLMVLEMEQPESGFWGALRNLVRGRHSVSFAMGQHLQYAPVPVFLDSRSLVSSNYRHYRKAALEVFLTGSPQTAPAEISSLGMQMCRPLHSYRKTQSLRSPEHGHYTFLEVQRPAQPKPFGIRSKSWITVRENSVLAHLWVPLGSGDKPQLVLVKHGVVVGVKDFPFCAVASAHGLDTDATGLAVVENRKFEELKDHLLYSLKREVKRARSLHPPANVQRVLKPLV